jgi:hypothetical protein
MNLASPAPRPRSFAVGRETGRGRRNTAIAAAQIREDALDANDFLFDANDFLFDANDFLFDANDFLFDANDFLQTPDRNARLTGWGTRKIRWRCGQFVSQRAAPNTNQR